MTRRYYANSAPQQTLASSITSSATTLTVMGSFSGWPSSTPFFACINTNEVDQEIVLVTAIVGTTATITRGEDGTTGVAHAAGAKLDHVFVRQDMDEANAHTSATSGVHGISGQVVGTNDNQTLTNKTINTSTLNSPTIASPTVTGTANFTGSGTGLSVANNATVTGTLTAGQLTVGGVTGAPLPSGSVTMYAGAALPSGWLLCDGAAVSRTTYASLFNAVGTAYGAGDGSTTFNLPNLVSRFPRGGTPSTGGGADAHTHTQPTHTHGLSSAYAEISPAAANPMLTAISYQTTPQWTGNIQGGGGGGSGTYTATRGVNLGGNTDASGGDNTGSSSNVPAYTALNFIIKT